MPVHSARRHIAVTCITADLLLLTACTAVSTERSPEAPVLVYTDTAPSLLLPSRMTAAIEKAYPGFRRSELSHYDSTIVRSYEFTSRQALNVVIGDFNADSTLDVVLDGMASSGGVRLCILSRTDTFEAVLVEEHPRGIPTDNYLIALPRGIPSTDSLCVAPLDRDVFVEIMDEKAALLFYYQDDRFHHCLLSD